MNDKVRLLMLANEKIVEDKKFLAFFLESYRGIENLTTEELLLKLNCDLEQYFRLGLCLAPVSTASDYIESLNKISRYIDISSLELNKIIKRVDAVLAFSTGSPSNFLIAARDKGNKK